MGKKILITGSTGFLGRNLVEELSKENDELYCLIRKPEKKFFFRSKKIKFIVGNITDKNLIKRIPKKIDIIYHLAGLISTEDYKKNYQINVNGTKNIISIAEKLKVKKIIYSSTINVAFKCKGSYSNTKRIAEKIVVESKTPSIIIRPSPIYGANDKGFSKIADYVKKGLVIPIIGSGKKYEQPIYIKELVELFVLCKNHKVKDYEIYNAAGKDRITFKNLIGVFEKHFKVNKVKLRIPVFAANFISSAMSLVMKNPLITKEQIYQINTDTNVEMKKTWKTFNYKKYNFTETLNELLKKGEYGYNIKLPKLKLFASGLFHKLKIVRNLIQKRPILIIFDITKRCNQRCNTCNIWKKGDFKNEMDFKQIENCLDAMKKFGIGYAFIQGGDPLMRADIKEIIIACIKRNIKPTLITNGIALNSSMINFLSELDCNLAVSIDSLDNKVYKSIRGVDTLDLVLRNLQYATLKRRKSNWSITTTVTQANYKEIWDLRKLAKSMGFMYAIRPYIYHLKQAGRADDVLVYKNKKAIIELFRKMIAKSREENFLASIIYESHLKYLKGKDIGRCDAMTRSFLVQENGFCSPCVENPNIHFSKDFSNFEKEFLIAKKKLNSKLTQCSIDTPCFYNDAREVGIIWDSKFRIIRNSPRVIKTLFKYGNFF